MLSVLNRKDEWVQRITNINVDNIRVCHNDLNSLNILLGEEIYLIDYDYVSPNYIFYDIANYMNEAFISYQEDFPGFKVVNTWNIKSIVEAISLYPKYEKGMEAKIIYFLCVANLYWAIWSLETFKHQVN